MTRFIILFSIMLSFGLRSSQLPRSQMLSDAAQATLITCGPGHEIWSHFGHTAIRIQDSVINLDVVFNYGMFDSSDPDFAVKFANRTMNYFLAVSTLDQFLVPYAQTGRYVYEQEIHLNKAGFEALYAQLLDEYEDESKRFYLYEFFYDNCATKPRDALLNAALTQGEFNWDESKDADQLSFRELIDKGFEETPWVDFGIDLVLGSRIDIQVDNNNLMFLPDYLSAIGEKSKLENGEYFLGPKVYLQGLDAEFKPNEPHWFTPPVFFWGLLIVFLMLSYFYRGASWMRFADGFLFLVFGVLGLLLVFMWFGTDHHGTKANYNLIWATPFHLFSIVVLFWHKLSMKIQPYFGVMASVMLAFILTFWLLPQSFHPATKPIVILLALRYYSNHLRARTKFRESNI